jgi:hypothetical protein
MPSAAELKAELRSLRKESLKPVSRMKVADIAAEIQKLKGHREETPAVAAVPSAPIKKSKAAVESIKEAKASEFPMKPDQGITAAPKKGAKAGKAPKDVVSSEVEKKKSKLAKLLEMMDYDTLE